MTKNKLTWQEYVTYFETLLSNEKNEAPYDDENYMNYVKLNHSRQERWLKKAVLNEDLITKIKAIDTKQTWNIITEPWCGDASHNVPFFYLLSKENPLIEFNVILRDTAPFMIDDYLTNGGKAIPKLVVKDEKNEDVFVWGPRPAEAQELFLSLKAADLPVEEQKIKLQQWYNKNKGTALQKELEFVFAEQL